jgi:hypothetical protein
MQLKPITCAPDADWYECESDEEGSREGSEDGDDY